MIKFLACFCIVIMTTPETACAQLTESQKNMNDVNQQVRSRCDVQDGYYTVDMPSFASSEAYSIRHKLVRSGWTGGCKNGLLDGEGRLVVDVIPLEGDPKIFHQIRIVESGLIVSGKRVGPWLQEEFTGIDTFDGLYRWEDAAVSGYYIKENDGSMQRVVPTGVGKEYSIDTSTEKISREKLSVFLRNAQVSGSFVKESSGKTPFKSKILQDLTGGGVVYKSINYNLGSIKQKKSILVFSSNTVDSFSRIDDFQKKILVWGATQSDRVIQDAAKELARNAGKGTYIDALTSLLRSKFGGLAYADDLFQVKKGSGDVVVVLDLFFSYDIDSFLSNQVKRVGSADYNSDSVEVARIGASYFILDDSLEVLRSDVVLAQPVFVGQVSRYKDMRSLLMEMVDSLTSRIGSENFYSIYFNLKLSLEHPQ